MFERFTDRAKKVMALANQEARRFNHDYLGTEHILLGLVMEGSGVGGTVLKNLDIDVKKLRLEVETLVKRAPDMVTVRKLPQTPRTQKAIEYAIEEARALNHNYVGTEHILLGLLREREGTAAQVLMNLGLKLDYVRQEVLNLLVADVEDPVYDLNLKMGPAIGRKTKSKTPALDSFGRDLTQLAINGELDPVIGRDREVEKVMRILSRRQRNSPLLIGPSGIGKQTIVEGLAQHIVTMRLVFVRYDKRLCQLDPRSMLLGTKTQGQFNERIVAVLNEVRRAGHIIMSLDMAELLPTGDGPTDNLAAVMLSSLGRAMHKGEAQMILAATNDIYEGAQGAAKYLFSLCTPVFIEAPSPGTLRDILLAHRGKLEAHHCIKIPDDVLSYVVDTVQNRVEGTLFPSAVIDIIDEACAAAAISRQQPQDIAEMSRRIEQLQQEKEASIRNAEYNRAAELRDEAEIILEKREARVRELSQDIQSLDAGLIKHVISSMTDLSIAEIDDPAGPRFPADRIGSQELKGNSLAGASIIPATDSIVSVSSSIGLSAYERHQTESILQSEHVEIVKGTGFVLLPHTEEFEDIFVQAIGPAMEKNGIEGVKADDIYCPGAILAQVWERIRKAEVIVADMSILNPNVIYELGLCHGLHRCPILLVRDPGKLPFNLRSLRYIVYENTVGGVKKMSLALERAVEEFLAATRSPGMDES